MRYPPADDDEDFTPKFLAAIPAPKYEPPDIQLHRCPLNPNAWAPRGSHAAGYCLCCFQPFPRGSSCPAPNRRASRS